jgi:hypothetical protein
MAKIIPLQFWRLRLPRRLPRRGRRLESPPIHASVIAFPKRSAPKPNAKAPHLTLITSGR